MALRNLNQSFSRGRICGTPKSGVIGSMIPATGVHGPGYLYRYLNLPADNDKEYAGYIPSLPTGLTFRATENSAFTASGADGVYVVPVNVTENGVLLFSTTFNIVFGSVDVTINATPGAAVGAGQVANVDIVISATAGNATAAGLTASITSPVDTTISPYATYSIAAENRHYVVAPESRTYTVAADSRNYTVN